MHTALKLHTEQKPYTRNTNILHIALIHFIGHKSSKRLQRFPCSKYKASFYMGHLVTWNTNDESPWMV